jgi:hypothetical protein
MHRTHLPIASSYGEVWLFDSQNIYNTVFENTHRLCSSVGTSRLLQFLEGYSSSCRGRGRSRSSSKPIGSCNIQDNMKAKGYTAIWPHYDLFHDPAPSSPLLVPSSPYIHISSLQGYHHCLRYILSVGPVQYMFAPLVHLLRFFSWHLQVDFRLVRVGIWNMEYDVLPGIRKIWLYGIAILHVDSSHCQICWAWWWMWRHAVA